MQFELNDEQLALQDAARRFARDEICAGRCKIRSVE